MPNLRSCLRAPYPFTHHFLTSPADKSLHLLQVYLHNLLVSQHNECVVAIEVLPTSTSAPDHHKVRSCRCQDGCLKVKGRLSQSSATQTALQLQLFAIEVLPTSTSAPTHHKAGER